ncbi:MAG: acetyl-CoA carboxylase biotin carboxyl carrier protein [Pseudomonadota bacterium]
MADKKNDSKEIEAAWIRELAGILDETGLSEIELEKGGMRLRVARTNAPAIAAAAVAPAPAPAAPAPVVEPASAPSPANHPGAIPSPMVGTAYLSPSPGSDAFVKVGDQVSEGQTLMIVEAMKTMNPIASPRGGVVKEILVQDAQPVEYGEALLIIE